MIEVREGRLGKSVHAIQFVYPGQVILTGWGSRVPRRTRHSFQVDHDCHVVINTEIELINHSCEPNCGVFLRRGLPSLEIHALRQIEPGEELTTDYATFEYEIDFMTDPCRCNTPKCRGRITGFRDLPDELKVEYGPYIAEYLREHEALVSAAI